MDEDEDDDDDERKKLIAAIAFIEPCHLVTSYIVQPTAVRSSE